MWKWLRRLLALLAAVVLVAVFVYHDGIQHVIGMVSGHAGVPEAGATANCDGITPCSSGPMGVLTFNVLCRLCEKEGFDSWDLRAPHLRDLIRRYDPDLLGLQELGGVQDFVDLLGSDSPYEVVSYRLGKWYYGDCALFYRRGMFELLDSGQFWLSPKPTVPFAKGWKPLSMPRYLNWALLRRTDNGFRFLYMNTHFDNNTVNKNPSAELVARTFGPLAKALPIIMTGDFNTDQSSHRFDVLRRAGTTAVTFENAMDLAEVREVIGDESGDAAPSSDDACFEVSGLIDHIFLAGPIEKGVARWVLDRPRYGPEDRRPSDHPAVFAEVVLGAPESADPASR